MARRISRVSTLGHFHIPETPLTLFGMFQWLLPNTNFSNDPLDFYRWVFGISYQYNEYLRFAIDSQNISCTTASSRFRFRC